MALFTALPNFESMGDLFSQDYINHCKCGL